VTAQSDKKKNEWLVLEKKVSKSTKRPVGWQEWIKEILEKKAVLQENSNWISISNNRRPACSHSFLTGSVHNLTNFFKKEKYNKFIKIIMIIIFILFSLKYVDYKPTLWGHK